MMKLDKLAGMWIITIVHYSRRNRWQYYVINVDAQMGHFLIPNKATNFFT